MFYLFLIVVLFFLFYVLFHFNEKFGKKSVDGENKNFKTLIFRGQDLWPGCGIKLIFHSATLEKKCKKSSMGKPYKQSTTKFSN